MSSHALRPAATQVAEVFRLALLGCAVALLVPVAFEKSGMLDEGDIAFTKHWLITGVVVAAAIACAARVALVREERAAWSLLSLAIASYVAGTLYWAISLYPYANPPFPSLADGFWLAPYPLAFVAFVLIARSRLRGFRTGIWIDGVLGGAALAAAWEAFALEPIQAAGVGLETLARATLLAYPVGDLLLVAVVVGVFALSGWSPGASWLLLGGGYVLFAAADTVYNAMIAGGAMSPPLALTVLWALGVLAIGIAAWLPSDRRVAPAYGLRGLLIPSAATVLALGVLVFGSVRNVSTLATALAAVAIVAGVVRAFFTFRELRALFPSREEAVTDYLTGLGNRRRLMRDLESAFRSSDAAALLLFDLDGFKTYNDRFGHVQGDLLLARLGSRLRVAVGSRGRAYRLGGDEFCVLVPAERGDEAQARAVEIAGALTDAGRGFRIGCAYGWALLRDEAEDASAALRLADTRMYAQKNGRPDAAKRQAATVALGILTEQQPSLERHIGAVAELALAIGRRLDLEPQDLDDLARAAELHDIGKVAIPTSILEKPGPLDAEEWRHVRRHTLVGERMLAAAPSLERVARIVRSTHERFDGTGYPDELEGQQIPLAARIIAVCDAFDAMTSNRSYRPPRSAAEAIAELERCAGGQFDPVVVEAFLALVRVEPGSAQAVLRAS